jgi:hypothetical protein
MGRFFGETFERRTGRALAVVAGDERLAALVALAAPSRPTLLFDAHPERSPWTSVEDARERGAVVLWRASDTVGAPPADLKQRFPDLVPELPHAFARERIGWAVIRPHSGGAQARPKGPAGAGR